MDNLAEHLSQTFNIDKYSIISAIKDFNDQNLKSNVEEPAVAYKTIPIMSVPTPTSSHDEVLDKIKSPMSSPDVISEILEKTGLTIKYLAEQVFEMTPKTFAKYKKENIALPKRFLELSIKLTGLYNLGIEVFGSVEHFNKWCEKPAIGLNFNIPKGYFSTVTGIEYVTEELQRIMMGYPV